MQLENYPDLLSVEHLAEIFDVSKNTIRKEIHNGKFGTPIRIGRAFKVPRAYVVEKYIVDYR